MSSFFNGLSYRSIYARNVYLNGVNIICEQSSGCNALRDVVAKTTRLDLIKLSHAAESMTSLVLLNNFITSSLSSDVGHD